MAAINELAIVQYTIGDKTRIHDVVHLNGPRIEDSTLIGRVLKARRLYKPDALRDLAQIALYVHLSREYIPLLEKPNGNTIRVPVGEYIPLEANDKLKFPLSTGNSYFTVAVRDENSVKG